MTISPNRLKQLQNLPDSEIDTSDIPELDEQFWQKARKVEPMKQEPAMVSLKTDWERVRNMSDEEAEQNALDDPDNPPLTDEQLERFLESRGIPPTPL